MWAENYRSGLQNTVKGKRKKMKRNGRQARELGRREEAEFFLPHRVLTKEVGRDLWRRKTLTEEARGDNRLPTKHFYSTEEATRVGVAQDGSESHVGRSAYVVYKITLEAHISREYSSMDNFS